jgi:hypothetical protein
MPTVEIPPPYQGPTGGVGTIGVDGKTVRECLDAIEALHPGFAPQVFDDDGAVHRFVRLFVNGELIDCKALDLPLEGGDVLELLAAIAGGSGAPR